MFVLTVGYRNEINLEYYLSKHIPAVEEVCKPMGLLRAEVRRCTAGLDGSEPVYKVMSSLYFSSKEAFDTIMQHPATPGFMADIVNFSASNPDFFTGEVLFDKAF